ncbi:hypothetical protein BJ878DRAFT_545173 [Calycina marina]|uniref:Myb-like domain-containing protein n=1 Tax=Calycina marina TaxID=1763456 RepID=A0A9P7YYL4_9HELO|nr:hypothetical protein BJ878DRAFT_545173 [Calycina marina]
MSLSCEAFYSAHLGRRDNFHAISTPHSAVSSFNIPVQCDRSLTTPVSPTQTRAFETTSHNTTFGFLSGDDERPVEGRKSPMKYKHPHHIATSESSISYIPYWAQSVSATPAPTQSEPSPTMNQSSNTLSSVSGMRNGSHRARLPTPSSGNFPVRIAPNPPAPRPALQEDHYLQKSGTTLHSLPLLSPLASTRSYSQPVDSFPLKAPSRKRKNSRDADDFLLCGDMTPEEELLIQLSEIDRLPWKEVAVKFREKTGKDMRVPALQMRKKRLLERIRQWTPADERALLLAMQSLDHREFDQVAVAMLKYGCLEKWPKDAIQKKWYEMHPELESGYENYELPRIKRHMTEDYGVETYGCVDDSDGTLMPSLTPSIGDERSRTGSVDSTNYSIEHHIAQHLRFGVQEEQNWP